MLRGSWTTHQLHVENVWFDCISEKQDSLAQQLITGIIISQLPN